MSRLYGIVAIYLIMLLGIAGVSVFIIVAPARFGNLLHDNLNLFPEVDRGDWGKKLFLRLIALALLAFAARIVHRIAGFA